ncbi:MAG: glycosyltransferase family 2 protein [Oscillospiraceae bacterium]|nr:glycosyltransferase family 2 protein [Oscillospiraceae bacterium]
MLISVITPTYNRAYILNKCYESLAKQTCKDFEWIIVDDGSTDNTEALVSTFDRSLGFEIIYIKQENGGKHVAHNTGVLQARGDLTVCLDSDDMLTETAIETAVGVWQEKQNARYTGILAKRGDFESRKPICGTWPKELESATMCDLTTVHGFYGDTVLFFRTEILKQNLFKTYPNERFMPEMNLYCDIDTYGEMLLVDEVLYLCEYLPDGLTSKYHKLLRENPNGTADTYYKTMLQAKNLKTKVKFAILTNVYYLLSKQKKLLTFPQGKLLIALTRLPAMCLKNRFLKRVEKGTAQ